VAAVPFGGSGRRDELFARRTEQLLSELLDSGMPVFGLSPSLQPGEACFGGLESSGGTIVVVHVAYGQWAVVDTARWDGGRMASPPLRAALEHHVRFAGECCADLGWSESPATLLVDGRAVAGRQVRAGDRWWAVRCGHADVEITVVGRDWQPGLVAVETMADLVPMLDGPRDAVPMPEGFREPHLALADAVLRNAAAQAAWLADGGPAPELLDYWSSLWRAVVRRQMELSGQPERVADHAVSSMMSQLAGLFHEAAWFREDADLRRRAVAEVLLYGTELGDVPSGAAQQAWHRRALDGSARLPAARGREWLAGWQEWAAGQD
jgi:hypothetical protein